MKTIKLFACAGIFYLFIFLFASASYAEKTHLVYINGIQNTLEDALKTLNKIDVILDSSESYKEDQKRSFILHHVWNPIGFYGTKDGPDLEQDLVELFVLKRSEEHYWMDFMKILVPFNILQPVNQEAAQNVNKYLEDLGNFDQMQNTKNAADKLAETIQALESAVVVAHSQGNLLANLAYANLVSKYGNDTKQMVRVVNVANTSAFSVNNLNFTHEGDAALFSDATKWGIGDKSLETLPSQKSWLRTTPLCNNSDCDFTIAIPTFGEPTTDIPDQGIVDKYLDHSIVETYLSTATVPVIENQGVFFAPEADRFRDRFVDFVYAAANSFTENSADKCGAIIAPGLWKEFDCYNLAAIGKFYGDDPFTPSWTLIGGYWQWGTKGPDSNQWYDTNTPNYAHGPTGPSSGEANRGFISGWSQSYAPDWAWSDSDKAPNDPCPAGFRLPTKSQWEGVLDNNTQSSMGTWSDNFFDYTNFSAARFFGNNLMLPAAGGRYYLSNGALGNRGYLGYYWSNSEAHLYAWFLHFGKENSRMDVDYRSQGYSVRCISDDSISLNLDKTRIAIKAEESEIVIIRDGTGNYTASSDNEQVATAQAFDFFVEITSLSMGLATITVEDSSGRTALIFVTVTPDWSTCGAYVAPDVWKEFDCYNLAAIGKVTGADPFTPSWELIGGYWQWGRKGPDPDVDDWFNTNTPNFAHGPTGPSKNEANWGDINNWDSTFAPDGAWSDSDKTANDPCPSGFQVPTRSEWDGILENNTQRTVGAWTQSATSYSSARYFGGKLMLPAAGYRSYGHNGALTDRGINGYYRSSSEYSSDTWFLYFGSYFAGANYLGSRLSGFSVRCIAE